MYVMLVGNAGNAGNVGIAGNAILTFYYVLKKD